MALVFTWDAQKCASNLEKHGIHFTEAAAVLSGWTLAIRSDRDEEVRWLALGPLPEGTLIAVVYTVREEAVRIISARKARTYEREAYRRHSRISRDPE